MIAALLVVSFGCSLVTTALLWAMDLPLPYCALALLLGIYVFWALFANRLKDRGESL